MLDGHLFGKVNGLGVACDGCNGWVVPVLGGGIGCGWCGWVGHKRCVHTAGVCGGKVKEERVCEVWGEGRVKVLFEKGALRCPVVALRYEKLGDEWCGVICDQLTLSKSLISLDLTGNRLSDEGGQSVSQLLACCSTLTSLNLSSNLLTATGLNYVSTHISLGVLTLLDVSKNLLTDECVTPLCTALAPPAALQTLNISDNSLTEVSLVKFASLSTIRNLDIGGNSFTPSRAFINGLASALLEASITSLGFKGSYKGVLGCEGAVYLSTLLRDTRCPLRTLDLSDNDISSDGAVALCQALHTNTTLTSLVLQGNDFNEVAVKVLSSCLNQSVTSLDVRNVTITPEGIAQLMNLPLTVYYGTTAAPSDHLIDRPNLPHWYGWCSSCYQHEEHALIQPSAFLLSRSLYQCRSCSQVSVSCVHPLCTSMANTHHYEKSLFCSAHSGTIQRWGTGKPKPLLRWCSWCLILTTHELRKVSDFSRDVYSCTGCQKRTLRCKKCNDAMCRGAVDCRDDGHCMRCSGGVKQWVADLDVVKETLKGWEVPGWCSWCYEDSVHTMESKGVVRNSYRCGKCCKLTLKCARCSAGMTTGALLCAQCEQMFTASFSQPWETLSEAKCLIFRGHEQRTLHDDLARQSNYKTFAKKAGLIRPFLLLAAMGPECRVRTALSVDITLLKCNCFGDSHSESWYIIQKGIIGRSMQWAEKVTPLRSGVQWGTVLKRLAAAYSPTMGEGVSCSEEGEQLLLGVLADVMMDKAGGKAVEELRTMLASDEQLIIEMKRRLSTAGITEHKIHLYALYSILTAGKRHPDTKGDDPIRSSSTSHVSDAIYRQIILKDGSKPSPYLAACTPPPQITLLPLAISILTQRLLLLAEGIDLKDFL